MRKVSEFSKKMSLAFAVAALCCVFLTPAFADTVPNPGPAKDSTYTSLPGGGARLQDEQNTIDVFNNAAPATVYVTPTIQRTRNWYGGSETISGAGSGIIWDKRGHIITNFHVIDGANSLSVTLYNQKTYPAKVVGIERKKDIAVLKIDAPASELTPIAKPKPGEPIVVGQKALAIGNPFGFDHTLTTGVISAIGRDRPGYGQVTIKDMIQTDCSINMGNSGGPLLNAHGQLIGMNTMIASTSQSSAGIGFAIPVSTIQIIVPQIIEKGHAEQIGMGITVLSDNVARNYGIKGVVIESVADKSPAAKAGLRGITVNQQGAFIGDIIIGINDKRVTTYDELYSALDGKAAGDSVKVKIVRDNKEMTLDVKLYKLPE